MRLHKYFLLGVTAVVAMAAMTGAALATTHTTTGLWSSPAFVDT